MKGLSQKPGWVRCPSQHPSSRVRRLGPWWTWPQVPARPWWRQEDEVSSSGLRRRFQPWLKGRVGRSAHGEAAVEAFAQPAAHVWTRHAAEKAEHPPRGPCWRAGVGVADAAPSPRPKPHAGLRHTRVCFAVCLPSSPDSWEAVLSRTELLCHASNLSSPSVFCRQKYPSASLRRYIKRRDENVVNFSSTLQVPIMWVFLSDGLVDKYS